MLLVTTTFGSDDVHIFRVFANEIARVGPLRIYQSRFAFPYNHAPLIGWFLDGLHWLAGHGLSFPAALRFPSIVADVGTAFIAFKVVERRFGPRRGLIAAALVAVNPVSVIVSGFHGNVDSIAFFFALLAFYLTIDRNRAGWGGVAFAIALGIKIVPVVVLPILAIRVFKDGNAKRFDVAFAATTALIWVPPALRSPVLFREVLGYSGGQGHIRPALAILIALSLAMRVSARTGPYEGAAAATLGVLLLSPAWAPQYFVWPIAFGAVASQALPAAGYAVVAGAFLIEIYTRWSAGFPWGRAMGKRGLDVTGRSLLGAAFFVGTLWLFVMLWSALVKTRLQSAQELIRNVESEAPIN